VADVLAKKAKDINFVIFFLFDETIMLGIRIWLEDLPKDITPLVLLDVY